MEINHKKEAENAISELRELMRKEAILIDCFQELLPAVFIKEIKEIHKEKLTCLGLFHWSVNELENACD